MSLPEYPHKFTGKLKGKSVVEHQEAFFEIDVEAEDAEVSWFQVRARETQLPLT